MIALFDNEFVAAALIALLCALVGGGFAWVFRLARTPGGGTGSAMLGGIVAGLLLGQTVGARVAPAAHETLLVGGRAERLAHERAERRLAEELAGLRATDVSPEAIEEHERQRLASADGPRVLLEAWLEDAEQRHWSRVITAGLGGALVALLLSQTTLLGARGDRAEGVTRFASVAAGLTSVAFAAAFTALFAKLLAFPERSWGDGLLLGAAVGAAFGVGSPFAAKAARSVGAPSRRKGVERAGGAALAAVIVTLGVLSTEHAIALLSISALLGGAAVGWLARGPLRSQRAGEAALIGVAAPGLVALATLPVDLLALGSRSDFWWLLVIGVLLAGDGRWLGGWLGWWIFGGARGRAEAWRRSAAMCNARVGLVTMVLLAPTMPSMSEATGAWSASAWHAIGAAVILASALVEVTSGARRLLGPRLDRGEPLEVGRDPE